MHLTPAGLPPGIPGIGDDIEAAIQQAPQFSRHSMEQLILPFQIFYGFMDDVFY
jgi:hypothetical protein